jgi:hypothetical protein
MILSKNNKNQWWWDSGQNLIYYGDPNLRVYVPDSNYDDSNTWEKPVFLKYSESNVDGHTVFGAEKYPHERQPVSLFERYFYLILFVSLITLVLILIFSYDKVFNRGESKK